MTLIPPAGRMRVGQHYLVGAGEARIVAAARYDEQTGKLLEQVEAADDGTLSLPTAGLWYVLIEAPEPHPMPVLGGVK